jgi:hypothetical protein
VYDVVVSGCRIGAKLEGYDRTYEKYDFNDNWHYAAGAWAYNSSLAGEGTIGPLPRGDVYTVATPSGPWIKYTPNTYDSTRVMLGLRTFEEEEAVTVTVTDFLAVGDSWEFRNPKDFHGTPFQSGTCAESTISINMSDDFACGVLVNLGQ